MKNKLLFAVGSLLLLFSIINIKPSFSSEPGIYYDGKTKKMIYYNISNDDLFNNFKNVIPGDVIEQEIKINTVNLEQAINMYLKIDYEENKDIVDNIIIKIYKNNQEIVKNHEMFKILCGNDNSVYLKIIMEVPTNLGNEISNYSNNLIMSFFVENDQELVEVPKTYEDNIYIYYMILLLAIVLLIITIRNMLKEKDTK